MEAKGIVTRMGRDDRLGERSEYSPVTAALLMRVRHLPQSNNSRITELMNFANGFLAGFLGYFIFPYLFIFSVIAGLQHTLISLPPLQSLILSNLAVLIVMPVVYCWFYRHKMMRKGLKSALFLAYRNIFLFAGSMAALLGVYVLYQKSKGTAFSRSDLTDQFPENFPPALENLLMRGDPAVYPFVVAAVFIGVAIFMMAYARRVNTQYALATRDNHVSMIAEGIQRAQSGNG